MHIHISNKVCLVIYSTINSEIKSTKKPCEIHKSMYICVHVHTYVCVYVVCMCVCMYEHMYHLLVLITHKQLNTYT